MQRYRPAQVLPLERPDRATGSRRRGAIAGFLATAILVIVGILLGFAVGLVILLILRLVELLAS